MLHLSQLRSNFLHLWHPPLCSYLIVTMVCCTKDIYLVCHFHAKSQVDSNVSRVTIILEFYLEASAYDCSDPNMPFLKSLLYHISITFLYINYVYPLWTHLLCILLVYVYLINIKYTRHSPFSNPILIDPIFTFDVNKHLSHVIIKFLLHDSVLIGCMMHSCILTYV